MMPRTSDEVSHYFQLVLDKKLADAEKSLEQIKKGFNDSENSRGYLKGLEGLLLSSRSTDDRYLYFNRIQMTSKLATEVKREFQAEAANELQAPYEKGYFTAMTDFMRVVTKVRPWSKEKGKASSAPEKPAVKASEV
jgi:hypothetical protein